MGQLNLFGNEVNERNAILQQLKSTNFGLNERINALQKEKKALKKGLEKHNKRMSKKMSLKASTSNEIHHHTLQPNKQHKHPKSANSVSAINLSSKSKKTFTCKEKNGHRHTTETEKMRTAITQLNLFGNEVNESNAILQQLKSTNFGLNERINALQKEKKALKKDISEGMEDRKLVSELKSELNELKQSMKI